MENFGYEQVNSFSRNLYNLEKMGAYYTPVDVCKRIKYLFAFPQGEFNTYDPTCGDGEALLAIVGDTKANTLGCELNEVVAKDTDKKFRDRGSGFVVNADFFCDLKSTYNVFDFAFANPPYMTDREGKRLETKCIEKMYGLQRKASYIAVVVPFYIVNDANTKVFLRSWVERYETAAVYRFDDEDYEKFKQIVLIGKKRDMLLSNPLNCSEGITLDSETERVYGELKELEKLPYLPKSEQDVPEEKRFVIRSSKLTDIKFFTTFVFDVEKAREELKKSPLIQKIGDIASTEKFGVVRVGNPPIPLGKDHMYLSAVAGAGMGFCGDEDEGTLHLQRGITKKAEQEDVTSETGGNRVKITVTSYIKTGINVIQQDGTISQLV